MQDPTPIPISPTLSLLPHYLTPSDTLTCEIKVAHLEKIRMSRVRRIRTQCSYCGQSGQKKINPNSLSLNSITTLKHSNKIETFQVYLSSQAGTLHSLAADAAAACGHVSHLVTESVHLMSECFGVSGIMRCRRGGSKEEKLTKVQKSGPSCDSHQELQHR